MIPSAASSPPTGTASVGDVMSRFRQVIPLTVECLDFVALNKVWRISGVTSMMDPEPC